MLFHPSRSDPSVIVYRDEYYPDRVEALRRVPGARFMGWAWRFPATSWPVAVRQLQLQPAHAYPFLLHLLSGRELRGLRADLEPGRLVVRGPASIVERARANLSVLCGYEEPVVESRQIRRTLVSLAEEIGVGPGEAVYRFPVGLLPRIARFLRSAGATVLVSNVPPPPPRRIEFPRAPELRDYQARVVAEAPRRRRATLVMPTGSGKTRTAAGLVHALGQRTLFLTTARELVRQTVATFEQQLGVPVGRVADGRCELTEVTVATVQSVLARVEAGDTTLGEWLRGVGLLICDEGHGLGARTIYRAATLVAPAYAFALTATPQRDDHKEVCIEAATGPVWRPAGASDADLVAQGYLVPVQVTCVPYRHGERLPRSPAKRFQVAIEENPLRNALLVRLIRLSETRYQTVVLVKTLKHGEVLARALGVPFVHGQLPNGERQRILDAFATRQIRCIVATPLLDQGVDLPAAEALIDAVPRKSAVKILQTVGRVRRPWPGKGVARVVTVVDFDGGPLERASLRRLDVFEQAGFEIRWLDAETLRPARSPAVQGA